MVIISLLLDIQIALDWLCAWLLEETAKRSEQLEKMGKSAFETRNERQVFYAKSLSIVFAQVSVAFFFFCFFIKF